MSILLPNLPGMRSAEPELLDFGAVQQGAQGGAAQRLNRLGNRFAINSVELPPAISATHGRIFVARLLRALTEGAIYPFPQPGFDPAAGMAADPYVNGAGQSGSSLALGGLPAGYTVREGQFFSIIHNGRRFLHNVASSDQIVPAGGGLTVSITPMLRISPANGAICEFRAPHIEGFVTGDSTRWRLLLEPYHAIIFGISEAM
jgi:hypothetical protein